MAAKLSQITLQPNFNAERYSGRWYTIAEVPQAYTLRCVYSTADYTLPPKRSPKGLALNVLNTCYDRRRVEIDSAAGEAYSFYPAFSAALTVRFSPADAASRKPNYLVHCTNYDEYSIVGTMGEAFWILCRHKKMNRYRFAQLLKESTKLGYDIEKLRITPHSIRDADEAYRQNSYDRFINLAIEQSQMIREYHDDPIGVTKKPKIERYLYDEASSLKPAPETKVMRQVKHFQSAVSLPEMANPEDHHQHLEKMKHLEDFPNILVPAGRR